MGDSRLDALFAPRSIALVGASTDAGSVGNDIARNLVSGSYRGDVYFVNPKTGELFGLPCYPDVTAIPADDIDLALIVVPARIVPSVLEAAATAKHIRAAVVISAGFGETGEAGRALEGELISIASAHDIALLGPNCLGFIVPSLGLNASFAPDLPTPGSVALCSQSGALMTAVLDRTKGSVGFSKFASTGNKATLGEADLLDYLIRDPATRAIALYSESFRDAKRLIRVGRSALALPEAKPIIALKSGRTEAGTRASGSHTGALAGSDELTEALLRQARIVRTDSLSSFLGTLETMSHCPLPAGPRLVIVTNAGGPGVLAVDAASSAGIDIAVLSEETRASLQGALPPAASVSNPVDVLGDARADRFRIALDAVSKDKSADIVLAIVTPQTMTEALGTAQAILDARSASGLTFVAAFVGGARLDVGRRLLASGGVPVFGTPEEAIAALAPLSQVASWRAAPAKSDSEIIGIDPTRARDVISRALDEGREILAEHEAYEVVSAYGFPVLGSRFVRSEDEARDAALAIGRPVALKIVSPDILHKTEAGGVMLDIAPDDARAAYGNLMDRVRARVPDARLDGAMVVEMAEPGSREIILGLKREPALGTAVLAGLGGIYAETFRDVAMRFAPLLPGDAEEMLGELRGYGILAGARGETGVDLGRLVELTRRLSRLAEDIPEIAELDLNPVLAYPEPDRFRVVDARVMLRRCADSPRRIPIGQ